jgi:hypothetical protein
MLESSMATIVRRFVKDTRVWEPRPLKVIHFDGLNPLEVRAQCALIRNMVTTCLPDMERAVVRARYGLTDYTDEDGQRRYFFDRERADAILFVALELQQHYADLGLPVLDLLVARVFADQRCTPITLRQLAASFGRSHLYYHHYYHAIDERLVAVENRALDTLTPVFTEVSHGESIA